MIVHSALRPYFFRKGQSRFLMDNTRCIKYTNGTSKSVRLGCTEDDSSEPDRLTRAEMKEPTPRAEESRTKPINTSYEPTTIPVRRSLTSGRTCQDPTPTGRAATAPKNSIPRSNRSIRQKSGRPANRKGKLQQTARARPQRYITEEDNHFREHEHRQSNIETSIGVSPSETETRESPRCKRAYTIFRTLFCIDVNLIKEVEAPKRNPHKKVVPHPRLHARESGKNNLQTTSVKNEKNICLVLDLDETLVHATFEEIEHPDFVVHVVYANKTWRINVKKRPYVDEFLEAMSQKFEIGVFTAALRTYAQKTINELGGNTVSWALYRNSCTNYSNQVVKDLKILNRDVRRTIIIDDNSHRFLFQPENGIQCSSFTGEPNDTELLQLRELLENVPEDVADVRQYLEMWTPTAAR
eukprot:gb/GECG01004736.1/.p1 GENE.gb/GECG01004736.1/~~gb/GECG01004736.1/.p1  ORF type:complete len:411 (+),score=30.96 gb/GECG01004736.1/:1-1233(+)